MNNQQIAETLTRHARQLASQTNNLYEIRAYRRAAEALRKLTTPVTRIVQRDGRQGLAKLPGLGPRLASTVRQLAVSDQSAAIDDQRIIPRRDRIDSLPGVGPRLAEAAWESLGVRTVRELMDALHNEAAASRLDAKHRRRLLAAVAKSEAETKESTFDDEPPVELLLRVDAAYQRKVELDCLPCLASARDGDPAEIPLLSMRLGGWGFRALFANSSLAHRLGKTLDCVDVWFSKEDVEGMRTIVTEDGQRVVRGREDNA